MESEPPVTTCKFRLWRLAGIALLCALAVGCSEHRKTDPLRVGANAWPGFEPLFVADDMGIAAPGSLHMVETPEAIGLVQALRNGTLDAAALTLSRVIRWPDSQSQPIIIMLIDWSNGIDQVVARPGINTLEDLRGLRVAAELESVNGYLLARALESAGMTFDDIDLVNIDHGSMAKAFENGEIDALSGYGLPVETVLDAGGKAVYSSADIPGEIIDVLAVRPEALVSKRRQIEETLRAWIKTAAMFESWPADTPYPSGALPPGDMRAMMVGVTAATAADNAAILAPETAQLETMIQKRWESAIARGVIDKDGPKPRLDPSIFLSVHRSYLLSEGKQ